MKTRSFVALCLIFATLAAKGQVRTIADLKPGDWFVLEHFIFFDTVPGNLWKAENRQKIAFRGVVRRKTKDELMLVFKPVHFYECRVYKTSRAQSYNHYDSYYMDEDRARNERNRLFYRRNDSIGQVFTEAQAADSMMVTIGLSTGAIKDTTFAFASGTWAYPLIASDFGFKFRYTFSYGTYFQTADARTLFTHTVVEYLNQWKTAGVIPGLVRPASEMPMEILERMRRMMQARGKIHTLVRLTGASFDLQPNTHLIYTTKTALPEKDLEFTAEGKKYRFEKQKNNSLRCSFFLSSPQKLLFDGITLLLTPGDSISFQKDDAGVCSFSGKGAAGCRYAQEKAKLSRGYPNGYDFFVDGPSVEDVERRITNITKIYRTLWGKYEAGMSDYWRASSRLSFKYWEMSIWLKRAMAITRNNDTIVTIPWDNESFTTTAPYLDGFYQPEGYAEFVATYFNYKMSQINSDNLSGVPLIFSWENTTESYHLQKVLLAGYPRYLLNKITLEKVMKQSQLGFSQKEYADFMHACRDPQLKAQIEGLHAQLEKLEPGARIQNLNLGLEKYLPTDGQAGYILMSFKQGGYEWDKSWTSTLEEALEKLKATDKVKICAFRPEEYQQALPAYMKNSGNYVFIPAGEMWKNIVYINSLGVDFVLVRNDGTIITREIQTNFWNLGSLIK